MKLLVYVNARHNLENYCLMVSSFKKRLLSTLFSSDKNNKQSQKTTTPVRQAENIELLSLDNGDVSKLSFVTNFVVLMTSTQFNIV